MKYGTASPILGYVQLTVLYRICCQEIVEWRLKTSILNLASLVDYQSEVCKKEIVKFQTMFGMFVRPLTRSDESEIKIISYFWNKKKI